MKIFRLLILSLFITLGVQSQTKDVTQYCIEEIKKLDKEYLSLKSDYDLTVKYLDSLKKQLDKSVTRALTDSIIAKEELRKKYHDSLADVVISVKQFQAVCKFSDEKLKEFFNHKNSENFVKGAAAAEEEKEEEKDNNVYLYFGKDKVISEEILTKKGKEVGILKDIISQQVNENYLGDITIPKDEEEFYFYKYVCNDDNKPETASEQEHQLQKLIRDIDKKESKGKIEKRILKKLKRLKRLKRDKKDKARKNINEKRCKEFIQSKSMMYAFKNVHVEINDGVFSDIRVRVETSDGNTHVYENKISVSILKFSALGKKNYLFYKHSIKKDNKTEKFEDSSMRDLYIKLSDVFVYDYKIGNHYVPSDLVLELPVKDAEGNITNEKGFATYKVKEESHISGIVELRAYTDFLALFGDSDNGLVQIEGKADFYILPFPMSMFGNSNLFEYKLFDKVSPKVNYSRFDEDTRYIETFPSEGSEPDLDAENQSFYIPKELDLVEKRYLTMGLDLDVFQFKRKGLPFEFELFGTLNYQLTELNHQNEISNIKAVSYGPGARLNFKKFNNFGFNYSANFSWYDYKNFNENFMDVLPEKFRVFSNEFEIFYFPQGNQNQSIFLRLRTFNNSEPKNDEAFYQFQFGYRFAIGTKSIKKNKS
jgi:hypothetical protein